jgi:2-keto-4-pentenoate hydratase/2-oxohepta-3-ene-1,7-dioic acid hydratase in catechol pathway
MTFRPYSRRAAETRAGSRRGGRSSSSSARVSSSDPWLVAHLTTIMTMEPGDVVLTGTPSAVGFAERPPRGLKDGDVCEVEIEGIGRLRNRLVDEARLGR